MDEKEQDVILKLLLVYRHFLKELLHNSYQLHIAKLFIWIKA